MVNRPTHITDTQPRRYNMCASLCCVVVAHLKSNIWMVDAHSQHNAKSCVRSSAVMSPRGITERLLNMKLPHAAAPLSPYQTRQCLWEWNTRLLVWLFCFTSPSNSGAVCSLACTCVGFPMWSRHINPFTRISAKLPCRQALHLKCTISYPCLVWMQHFSNIKPEGKT